MIAHYLAVALAKFRKTPFTTAANVLTLALGLACFIAAYGIATYWRSADAHHANSDRTFVVGQSLSALSQDGPEVLNAVSSATLARHLRADFADIERIARVWSAPERAVATGADKALLDAAFVDPDFPAIFDLEFLAGDPRTALATPGSVVLTAAAAQRLFGDEPAVGKTVRVDDAWDGEVTGVIASPRQPSFMGDGPGAALRFEMLSSWGSAPLTAQLDAIENWIGVSVYTVVTLPPELSLTAFNARLPDFLERNVPPEQKEAARISVGAFPLSELTTRGLDNLLFARSGMNVTAVSALLGLGILTLLVASVNYANLATAQAASRAKEVGLRRVLGAGRPDVMSQAWLEAALLALAATAVALGVLALAAPFVRSATGIDVLYFLGRGLKAFGLIAALVALVAFFAGAYPAFVLSRVRPAEALESGRVRSAPRLVARLLVGVQFASASFLLILVVVTQLQRAHLERTALAPREDPIVVLNDVREIGVDYDTLAARLIEQPGIRSVSVTDLPPWTENRNGILFSRTLEAGAAAPAGIMKSIGHDYFETLNLDVLAGRAFDRERDTTPVSLYTSDAAQTPSVVLDERFAERLGFATPEAAVGEIIYVPETFTRTTGRPAQPVRIIAVTESERTRLAETGMPGHAYVFSPMPLFGEQRTLIRLAREDVATAVASITEVWNELAPNVPVNIRFFDDLFEESFRTYARVAQIFVLLASAAFVIASIGLLGMAVHVASRRRHEIGVRKTLGSTTLGIVRLLLIDFAKPVLAANLLAWPLAYFAAQTYLAAFADRAPLTPAPFALSLALTLAIAWAAVIGEVLKAASVRPAEVLRHA